MPGILPNLCKVISVFGTVGMQQESVFPFIWKMKTVFSSNFDLDMSLTSAVSVVMAKPEGLVPYLDYNLVKADTSCGSYTKHLLKEYFGKTICFFFKLFAKKY